MLESFVLACKDYGRIDCKVIKTTNLANLISKLNVDDTVHGKLISTGNIITANGKYCVRLVSIPENNKSEVISNEK